MGISDEKKKKTSAALKDIEDNIPAVLAASGKN
jgi:hypothetical protein